MNRKPRYYSQHDKRWASWPYQAEGEKDTISASGCGPTCAAMLIETLTGKTYTPADAAWWSREHGYKAKGQGTYYSYFEKQFAAVGLSCRMLRWSNAYGKPDHPNHKEAMDLLRQGWYVIACMGPGNWTNSGHFIVVWWADGVIHINDPNSTRPNRINGDPDVFFQQVKYYWVIDARAYNGTMPKPAAKPQQKPKEDDEMTKEEIERYAAAAAKKAVEEKLNEIHEADQKNPGTWEKSYMERAHRLGLCDGTRPRADITRGEVSTMMCHMADMMLEVADSIKEIFGQKEEP